MYIFTKDISEKTDIGKPGSSNRLSSAKKTGVKYTLINFIKEIDIRMNESNQLMKSQMFENYKDLLQNALIFVNYMFNCSIFYQKIIRKELLDNPSMYII